MELNSEPVIAIVGLAGTGKSTLVTFLAKQLKWQAIYFGGQVLDQVKERGLAVTPENERLVREGLREEYGPACMAILALKSLDPAAAQRSFLIDGLYSYAELKVLKKQFGARLHTIAIHAPFEKRVERLGTRNVRPLSRAEIIERDRTEIENLEKAPPIALAEHHIVNDAQPDQIYARAEAIMATIGARPKAAQHATVEHA